MAQNDIYLVRQKADGSFEEIANSPFQYDAASAADAPDKANNTFHINTKLRVDELEVNGDTTIIDTDTTTSEQLFITNDGTGPAVIINQLGQEPLIQIKDDGHVAFFISGETGTAGYVGIDTILPSEKLEINQGNILIESSHRYMSKNVNGSKLNLLGISPTTNNLELTNGDHGGLFISDSGFVGINNESPTHNLHVKGSVHGFVQIEGETGDSGIGFGTGSDLTGSFAIKHVRSSNKILLGTQNSISNHGGMLAITGSGNVGIGTDSPRENLEVNGNVLIASYDVSSNPGDAPGSMLTVFSRRAVAGAIGTAGSGIDFMPLSDSGHCSPFIRFYDSDDGADYDADTVNDNNWIIGADDTFVSSFVVNWGGDAGSDKPESVASGSPLSGSKRLFIDGPTGRFGLNTSDPHSDLHLGNSSASSNWMTFQNNLGRFQIGISQTNSPNQKYFSIYDKEEAAHRIFVDASGNVGIGTASPSGLLSIYKPLYPNTDTISQRWSHSEADYPNKWGLSLVQNHTSGNVNYIFRQDHGATTTDVLTLNDGDVGIGTTTPRSILELAGDPSPEITFTDSSIGDVGSIEFQDGYFNFWSKGNSGHASAIKNVTITKEGDVGIGTASPSSALHVKGGALNNQATFESTDGTSSILFKDPFGTAEFGNRGDHAVIMPAGFEKMRITSDGNVGIGTTSPTAPLDIDRDVSGFNVDGHMVIQNTPGATDGDCQGIGFSCHANQADGNIKNWFGTIHTGTYGKGDFIFLSNNQDNNNAAGISDEVMRITSDGNVGIGTDDPQRKLDIAGNVRASNIDLNTDSGFSAVFSKTNKAPAIKFMGMNSSVGLNYSIGVDNIDGNNNKLHINRINDADQFVDNLLTIKSDGNVGIGTTGPNQKLEVLKTGGGKIRLSETTARYVEIAGYAEGDADGSTMAFSTNQGGTSTLTERMRIDSDGNVGIGTSSPGSALHVAGGMGVAPLGTGVHAGVRGTGASSSAILQLNGELRGYIDFSKSGTDLKGRILYDNTDDYMEFYTNQTRRMIINSSETTVSNSLIANGGAVITSNEDNDTPELTLRRFTDTNESGADDIVDIRVGDSSLNFVINNDSDGDSGTYSFNRMANGVQIPADVILGSVHLENRLRHKDDTNTYLEFHNQDEFRLVTGGGERFKISNAGAYLAGNVGIGTTTPTAPLDIDRDVSGFNVDGHMVIQNTPGATDGDCQGIGFSCHGNQADGNIKNWFGTIHTGTYGKGDFIFLSNNQDNNNAAGISDEVMRIKSSGYVGIGTPAPSEKLHISAGKLLVAAYDVPGTATDSVAGATFFSRREPSNGARYGSGIDIVPSSEGGHCSPFIRFYDTDANADYDDDIVGDNNWAIGADDTGVSTFRINWGGGGPANTGAGSHKPTGIQDTATHSGNNRLSIDGPTGNLKLFSGDIYMPSNIRHVGDANTYFGFHGDDSFGVTTNASQKLLITNSATTVTNNLIANGGAVITTTANQAAPQLTLRRHTDTNQSGTDDIVDITVGDSHMVFTINNDSDGGLGTYEFRKTAAGAEVLAPVNCGTITTTDLQVGDGSSTDAEIRIYKKDDADSDHLQFYNGTTRVGEIGCEDTTWLRINQETAKNIYTPRMIRADGGFNVDNITVVDANGNIPYARISGAPSQSDNNFTNALKNKLDGIATGATNTAAPHYTSAIPVGDGGLTQKNFTTALKNKLDGIASSATNTAAPAITTNGSTPSLASGITAAEIRSLIGAGSSNSSFTGNYNDLTNKPTIPNGSISVLGTGGANLGVFGDDYDTLKFIPGANITMEAEEDNGIAEIEISVANANFVGTGTGLQTMLGTLEVRGGASGESIRAAGDIVALATMTSDDALKTNKVAINGALDKVCSLNGFTFDWNEKAAAIGIQEEGSIGLSAQEIEKVVPEVVKPLSNTEYKYVNYEKLVPVLVEAIKELKSEIEQLKSNQCDC